MTALLLNAEQAGELLNVPASWVLAEARADRIPHMRLGRYVRFDGEELLAWAHRRQRGPTTLARDNKRPRAVAAAEAMAQGDNTP